MAVNEDAAAIAKRFAAIPDEVKKAVRPAIDKGAAELVARMKYLAPDETGTGALKGSIQSRELQDLRVRVEAGGQATTDAKGDDHALNQEYGTAKMERHPFFWPSVNTLKTRVKRRIDRAIGQAVKAEWVK